MTVLRVRLSLNLFDIKKKNNLNRQNDTLVKKKSVVWTETSHTSRKINLISLNKKLGEAGQ